MVPQLCGIHQLGMRFGSSLVWRKIISIPAMAGPALSPGQVWEQHKDPEPGEEPQGPSCCLMPLPSLYPAASPTRQCPGPVHTPGKGPLCFQQGAMRGTASCLRSQPPFSQYSPCMAGQGGTGPGLPAACSCLCPAKGHVVVPALAVCWHAGAAHLSSLAVFPGLSSDHVPSATSLSPGTPMAEPVRDRGWQSAWQCGAKTSQVPSWAAAVGVHWVPSTPRDRGQQCQQLCAHEKLCDSCSKASLQPCVLEVRMRRARSPLPVGGWHIPRHVGSPVVGPGNDPCPRPATTLALVGKAGMESSLPPQHGVGRPQLPSLGRWRRGKKC